MRINPIKVQNFLKFILYSLLTSVILWQGVHIFISASRPEYTPFKRRQIEVTVTGEVKKPGVYKVPFGTSKFEILQVAGLKSTSNITPFNLSSQVNPEEQIDVSASAQRIGERMFVILEFFIGNLSIIDKNGRLRTVQEGMQFNAGDRIVAEENSQAEMSLNRFSRVDMDNFSEIIIDNIGVKKNGKETTEIFQKNGVCWYNLVMSNKDQMFRINTPLGVLTISGKGADFTVNVTHSEVVIENNEGIILAERQETGEVINLIEGQQLTIKRTGEPFRVTSIAREVSLMERFSEIRKKKSKEILENRPFNFVVFTPPNTYYLVNVQFDKRKVNVINIPAVTSISKYIQGLNTLQEAILYGGIEFANSFLEHILSARLTKYVKISKYDIVKIAQIYGGVEVDIDENAASNMNIKQGRQKLSPEQLTLYLSIGLTGVEDSKKRHFEVFHSLFNSLKGKGIVITSMNADQISQSLETNIYSAEILKHYRKFMAFGGWKYEDYSLPGEMVRSEGKTLFEADIEACRKLL